MEKKVSIHDIDDIDLNVIFIPNNDSAITGHILKLEKLGCVKN